jgi:hypothetical protein
LSGKYWGKKSNGGSLEKKTPKDIPKSIGSRYPAAVASDAALACRRLPFPLEHTYIQQGIDT